MSTLHPPPSTTASPAKRQALSPLFALATAMMGVGFWAATSLRAPGQELIPAPPALQELLSDLPTALDRGGEPVLLAWGPPSALSYQLVQRAARPGLGDQPSQVQTILQWTTTPQPRGDGPEGQTALTFSQVRAHLSDPSTQTPLAPEMAAQIEQVLHEARASMTRQPHGPITSYAWTSNTNPQLDPTLRVIEDAQRLLSPHMRRDQVRPGDVWSYDLPWAGQLNDNGVTATGGLKIDNTFSGWITEQGLTLAVIKQRLTIDGKLALQGKEADITGDGDGIVYFEPSSGRLHKHVLRLAQRWQLGESTQQVTLELLAQPPRSAAPEAGQK